MDDCIYREAALQAVDKRIEELRTHEAFNRKTQGEIIDLSGVKTYLLALPSADVKPVVHGHWIERYRNGFGNMICECSNCHSNSKRRNFCFNCGADMR